ncbi:hypothetical protein BDW59DRAFT_114932 [Aspergillus cavernicola]|uniref:Uncharacterized protein n=1 Tax=Aspergillus cavernicola TaxID=176166 RepID=A0ABR4IWB1_9EURO
MDMRPPPIFDLPAMVHILLQWDSLISLFVTIPSCHLLSVSETEAIASMILPAKKRLSSTKRTLPVQQQLFIDLFVKMIVGTAYIPENLVRSSVIVTDHG